MNLRQKVSWRKLRQLIYILAPLVLASLLVLLVNVVPFLRESGTPEVPTATPRPTQNDTAAAEQEPEAPALVTKAALSAAPTSVGTAPAASTITPSATDVPTPTATPPFPEGTTIELLGPPADGVFSLQDRLTFYWLWPAPLAEGHQFAVYWLLGSEVTLLGSVAEPNLGLGYRLGLPAAELSAAAGSGFWQVQLMDAQSGTMLAESEIRSLSLVDGG